MAPAALDTIITHLKDTGRSPSYYDLIITGDLGYIGKEIVSELSQKQGYNIKNNYNDCGVLIFDKEKQDTHSRRFRMCMLCNSIFRLFIQPIKRKKTKKNTTSRNRSINEFNNNTTRRNNSRNSPRHLYRNMIFLIRLHDLNIEF